MKRTLHTCTKKHHNFHHAILHSPVGVVEAVICGRCHWLLQRMAEGWRVAQVFK